MSSIAMPHRLRPKAAADIRRIYSQGAEMFGVEQAESYASGLGRTFEFLSGSPHAARLRLEVQPPVRAFRYKSHLIIYDVEPDHVVTILRVRHGREDWISDPL